MLLGIKRSHISLLLLTELANIKRQLLTLSAIKQIQIDVEGVVKFWSVEVLSRAI